MHTPRRFGVCILVLVALGATLGSLLDAIHTHFGATSYTSPVLAGAAWWVPLVFACAYLLGVARPLVDKGPRLPAWKAALGMALFLMAYGLSVAPWPWLVRAAVLGGLFGIGFWFCDRTRTGLVIAIAAALIGPAVESLIVRSGSFIYHDAFLLGVAGWLPFLYLTAAVGLGSLAKWIVG